jgi:hypothetical protein
LVCLPQELVVPRRDWISATTTKDHPSPVAVGVVGVMHGWWDGPGSSDHYPVNPDDYDGFDGRNP